MSSDQQKTARPEAKTPTTGTQTTSGGATRSVQLKRDASRAGDFAAQEALLAPVQRKGGGAAKDVHAAAARGTSGSGGALPHADRIQKAFGDHDISHIKAHTDGAAAEGSAAMGAEAYATGDHVAFKGAPDLHTAAHEAAHVVQQQGGVQLAGGVGKAGDSYEQNADAVADAVVAGKDASGLLGKAQGGGGGRSVQQAVQKKGGNAAETRKPADTKAPADGITREGVSYTSLNVTKAALDGLYTKERPKHKSKHDALVAIAANYGNKLPADWTPPVVDADKEPVKPAPAAPATPAAPANATPPPATNRIKIELKAWIPHSRVVDPEQLPADFVAGLARTVPTPVRTDIEAHYRGDSHAGYGGSYRVLSAIEFDWNGTQITGMAHSGSYGASHRDWVVRLLALGYEVAKHTGTDSATASSRTSGSGVGTAGFSLGMSSANPLVRTWAPTIDSELTGTLSGSTMSLNYVTDLFPSHGIRVTKDGRELYSSVVNDASSVNALGAVGAVNVGQALTTHSNSGSVNVSL